MNHRPFVLLWIVGAVLTAGVLLWFATDSRERNNAMGDGLGIAPLGRGASDRSTDDSAALAASGQRERVAPADPGSNVAPSSRGAGESSESESRPDEEKPLDALARWARLLCHIAEDDLFHERAWPIVKNVANLGKGSGDVELRLEDWVQRTLSTRGASLPFLEHADFVLSPMAAARVTGALGFAWALALPENEAEKLDQFRKEVCSTLSSNSPLIGECARAAWLATALRMQIGDSGSTRPRDDEVSPENRTIVEVSRCAIPLKRFSSITRLRTYPVLTQATPHPQAFEDVKEFSEHCLGNNGYDTDAREERFTKEVALITILGPGSCAPGPCRDQLWKWCEGMGVTETYLAEAASFVLSFAAQYDPALGEALFDLAMRRTDTLLDPAILVNLSLFGVLPARVALAFGDIVKSDNSPRDTFRCAFAIGGLQELLKSENPEVRAAAEPVVLERLLDSETPFFNRKLLLHSLLFARNPLLIHSVGILLDSQVETPLAVEAVRTTMSVPNEMRSEAIRELQGRFHAGMPDEVRVAIVRAIAVLGRDAEKGWLLKRLSLDSSEAVRAEIQKWIEK